MHPGIAAPVWLAALAPTGELSMVDVAIILADRRDSLLGVLRRRCGAAVHRATLSTPAGTIHAYLRPADSAALPRPHNAHAQHVLQRLGLTVGPCLGTVLFLGGRSGADAGLTRAQLDLLERHTLLPAEVVRSPDLVATPGPLVMQQDAR